ncbi:hypothetical protein Leryth_005446 [Lithospermum erythrorhizon]|uniref:Inositol-tetrakisphosphate 1-kinase n=1 Tax=Lithospermum erythrorhizon TaxID=34254 RepID=A0AAV3R0H2_LITER|nr:hypothetical protein Leryth_005446 [Lithospermum erythrorhizon]
MASLSIGRRYTVGYALAPKKQASFIQDSLINLAQQKGIDIFKIEIEKPLIDQGPFDCILHKLYGEDWKNQLLEYSAKYPNALILDSPESIQRLHNRITMLEVVTELEIDCKKGSFGIPKQFVIEDFVELTDVKIRDEGLKFPVIAKPMVADGSAKSHKMSLVYNNVGLNKLKVKYPIVLQEFVNHGGVIFKVYVVGEFVKCVKRKSLPDVSEEKLGSLGEGVVSFSQVSNLSISERTDDKVYDKMMMNLDYAEFPPMSLITDIALGLRKAMKLHLFNFDVIRDSKVGDRYLVIDINYFPGYAKMPDYERVLTDFFLDVLSNNEKGVDCLQKTDSFDKEARLLVEKKESFN